MNVYGKIAATIRRLKTYLPYLNPDDPFRMEFNQFLLLIGRQKVSFSKRIKNSVKKAVKFIGDFENTVAEIAIQNNYDFVSCGHIHQPAIKDITIGNKTVTYLNSGDWVESLTALEYKDEEWKIFNFNTDYIKSTNIENEKKVDLDSNLKHDFL